MIVVLDTSVVVSDILVPGGPLGKVVDLWMDGAFTVSVSPALIREYLGVLLRPKFQSVGSAEERTKILEALLGLENTVTVLPKCPLNGVAEDPADNCVLECAEAGSAECVVSGDRHLLALRRFGSVVILSPVDFLKRFFSAGGSGDQRRWRFRRRTGNARARSHPGHGPGVPGRERAPGPRPARGFSYRKVPGPCPGLADGIEPEDAVLAALLHDLGKANWPEVYFILPAWNLLPPRLAHHPGASSRARNWRGSWARRK